MAEYGAAWTSPRRWWRAVFERVPPRGQQGVFEGLEALKAARDARLFDVLARARARLGDVEELRGHGALFLSIHGMTRVLDPYSGLVEGKEWARGSADDSAPGLGMELVENHGVGPLVVKNVVPGGPAQRGGLRPGDRITHVHGKAVEGKASPFRLTSAPKGGPPAVPPPPGAAVPVMPCCAKPARARPVRGTRAVPPARRAAKVRLGDGLQGGETVLGGVGNDNGWDYWAAASRRSRTSVSPRWRPARPKT